MAVAAPVSPQKKDVSSDTQESNSICDFLTEQFHIHKSLILAEEMMFRTQQQKTHTQAGLEQKAIGWSNISLRSGQTRRYTSTTISKITQPIRILYIFTATIWYGYCSQPTPFVSTPFPSRRFEANLISHSKMLLPPSEFLWRDSLSSTYRRYSKPPPPKKPISPIPKA